GGNPLFVIEMLAIASDTETDVVVPPTLQALLAARLDQLDPVARRVLECAAVEGEVFHHGAVMELGPDEEREASGLEALRDRQLIRPEKSPFPNEEAYRFSHILFRDAAYRGLAKATRADMHERYAGWVTKRGLDLPEVQEIAGHHLEQAAQ